MPFTAIQSQVPSKVQGVSVTRSVQGSSPALSVSWSAVSGSGITYTVCYSTTRGTQSDPPSGANCDTSGITGTSTTLGPLSGGTTYYIWVRAVSSGRLGPYSDREQGRTFKGEQSQVIRRMILFCDHNKYFDVRGMTVTCTSTWYDCDM